MADLDPRVTPARPDLAARFLEGRVTADRFVEGKPARVLDGVAPLRREPRPDARLDTEALMGERLTIFEEDAEGWAWVQLHRDGYVGWIPTHAYLKGEGVAPTHKVAALRTFLYPGPSIKLPPVEALSLNAALAVTGESGDFFTTAHGGHIFRQHLCPREQHEPDFVAVAERFVGVPYLWGGKTSLGLDCSALTQLALAAAGIAAPRDSDLQEKGLGQPVAFDEGLADLHRGDLVFWKGHVGIMTDPETLLHATAYSMTVMKEPLRAARDRILAKSFGAITSIRRLA